MSQHASNFLIELLKLIGIALLKITALVLAFTCRVLSFLLEQIGQILEQMCGYGDKHK
jgi:hypothetical protein